MYIYNKKHFFMEDIYHLTSFFHVRSILLTNWVMQSIQKKKCERVAKCIPYEHIN